MKLQDLRKTKGITQQQLADKLGISKRTIENYEEKDSNLINASYFNLLKIARYFGVSINEIVESREFYSVTNQAVKDKGLGFDSNSDSYNEECFFDLESARKEFEHRCHQHLDEELIDPNNHDWYHKLTDLIEITKYRYTEDDEVEYIDTIASAYYKDR